MCVYVCVCVFVCVCVCVDCAGWRRKQILELRSLSLFSSGFGPGTCPGLMPGPALAPSTV